MKKNLIIMRSCLSMMWPKRNSKTIMKLMFLLICSTVFFSTAWMKYPAKTFEATSVSQDTKVWYIEGNFRPTVRIEVTVTNTLDVKRHNAPVIIPRQGFPIGDLREISVTVVDPSLPGMNRPDSILRIISGHELRNEVGGHAIPFQMDDLDKDGIWDEIFFITDIEARQSKTFFIYIGQSDRGYSRHYTHANLGHYFRHVVPFWETETIGWKFWFGTSADVYAKREPMLMSNYLYMLNLDGYEVAKIDHNFGSDIQRVANSMGGCTAVLFENPDNPAEFSMPRRTPAQEAYAPGSSWNGGQITDTRYVYDVVTNGPLRSTMRIKLTNWYTGKGYYEMTQTFTAYAKQSYCIGMVEFPQFQPFTDKVSMGVGTRVKPEEDNFVNEPGLIITSGPEYLIDPNYADNRPGVRAEMVATGIIVPDRYKSEYQYIPTASRNHALRVTPAASNSYEFMLLGSWSESTLYNTTQSFNDYCRQMQLEYNNPLRVSVGHVEVKYND